jgi:hypothetical protein
VNTILHARRCCDALTDTVSDFDRYGENDFDRRSEKNILFEMNADVIDAPHCGDLFAVHNAAACGSSSV